MSSQTTMNALYSAYTDPADKSTLTLSYTTRPLPAPTAGYVLVQMRASGVNPSDAANALVDRFEGKKPIIPGRDFAGTIVAAPDDTSLVGTEVFGCSGNRLSLVENGTHAEYVLVPSDGWALKPATLSWLAAGAVGTPYTTAWMAATKAGIRAGRDLVLVLGATGAVGQAAVNIARGLGCRVITASRRDSTDVNTETDRELRKVVELTGGKGADVILDATGATELMERAIKVLAKGGRYGFVSAGRGTPELRIDASRLYRLNQTLTGANSSHMTMAENAEIMRQVAKLWVEGKMTLPTEDSLEKVKLESGVEAYHEAAKISGKKYVLVFDV